MKTILFGVLLLASGLAIAQEGEPLDPQTCISYMERSLMATMQDSSGFRPEQADWRGIRSDADRCGAWHAAHIEDPARRALFAKAFATYTSGVAAPSMNAIATFSYDSLAFTTAR